MVSGMHTITKIWQKKPFFNHCLNLPVSLGEHAASVTFTQPKQLQAV